MLDIDLNPLDILGARRLDFLAPHLKIIVLRDNVFFSGNEICRWVEKHLKGRYYYGSTTQLVDDRVVPVKVVAFEDHYESSIFLLKCPHIGQK